MALESSALIESVIAFLLPYFIPSALDIQDARNEIIDTIASYAARTRAEYLQAARIIAFGMTSLDVLAEAKTADMSVSMRIRYRGCANNLNRTTTQLEKALDQRLARDLPHPDIPHSEPPQTAEPAPRPVTDTQDADPQSAVSHATAAHRLAPASHRPAPGPLSAHEAERNKRLWAGAMMDTLQQMGIPVQPVPAP